MLKEYGTLGTVNGNTVPVFINERSNSFWKKRSKLKYYTGIETMEVYVAKPITDIDVFVIAEKTYFVYETKAFQINEKLQYTEAFIYEDDFTKELSLYEAHIKIDGCNEEELAQEPKHVFKGRISPLNEQSYLDSAFEGGQIATHIAVVPIALNQVKETTRIPHKIPIKLINTISPPIKMTPKDIIVWGKRSFQILSYENLDEATKFYFVKLKEIVRNG